MNKSVNAFALLPALSSVLQVVRASHSSSSIIEAVTLCRTYFDGLLIRSTVYCGHCLFTRQLLKRFCYQTRSAVFWSRCSLESILLAFCVNNTNFSSFPSKCINAIRKSFLIVFLYAAINVEEISVEHGM